MIFYAISLVIRGIRTKKYAGITSKKNNNKVLKCDLCHIFNQQILLQLKHDKSFMGYKYDKKF